MSNFVKLIKFIRKAIPHICITISGMYIVFYCINNVNTSMKFLDYEDTPATFVLLLILAITSIINSAMLIWHQNKRK